MERYLIRSDLLNYLFYICIFSIFLKYTYIYPVFFSVFISLVFIIFFLKKKLINLYKWQIYLFVFFIWALSISILFSFKNTPESQMILKLLVNILFLFSIPLYLKLVKVEERIKKNIFRLLEIIITLTFLQIVYIYIKLDLFNLILSGGIVDSSQAYIITSDPSIIVFGSLSKNIWSTKVALIQLAYLVGINERIYNISKFRFYLFLSIAIANIILLLGRTSQLAFFSGLIFMFIKYIIHNKNLYKYVLLTMGSLSLSYLLFKLFPILFRIKFDITDGGYVRTLYWQTFFSNIWNENFVIGNGQLFAHIFLKKYAPYYIGENNMHNVFLNMILDFGFIGLTLYLIFIFNMVRYLSKILLRSSVLFLVVFPLLVIFNLQYLGYDNDFVIFISIILFMVEYKKSLFLNDYSLKKEIKNENILYNSNIKRGSNHMQYT